MPNYCGYYPCCYLVIPITLPYEQERSHWIRGTASERSRGREQRAEASTPAAGAGGHPVLIQWTLWILMTAFLKLGDVHCWRQPRSFCIGPGKCFQLPFKFIYLFNVYWLGTGPQVNITSPCPTPFSKCYCLAQGSFFQERNRFLDLWCYLTLLWWSETSYGQYGNEAGGIIYKTGNGEFGPLTTSLLTQHDTKIGF